MSSQHREITSAVTGRTMKLEAGFEGVDSMNRGFVVVECRL